MNLIKYILIILIFLLTQVYAVDISAQIAQLKNVKKSEKYIIMNKIKMQIAQLNSAQRAKAISQLRGAMTGNKGNNIQVPKITVPSMPATVPDMPQIPVTIPAIPQIPATVPDMPQMPISPSTGDLPIPKAPVPLIPTTMQVPKGGK